MKVIAIVGDEPQQRALTWKIHQSVPLSWIARIARKPARRRKLIRSAVSLTFGYRIRRAWRDLLRHYDRQFPHWPNISTSSHISANAEDLGEIIDAEKPDLIVVSGTDLLKKATLDRFDTKVMNLHTGLSPYIRGGPNCTNWALALGEFDLIGNTVMWIDPGIDSGAIISTERTPLTGHESLSELHLKVMEHAHDLYCRAIQAFARGAELPSVPQRSIAEGRMFYNRQWNSRMVIRAVLNHAMRYRPFKPRPEVKLIGLRNAA